MVLIVWTLICAALWYFWSISVKDIIAEMDRLHEIETKMKNMVKGYRSDLTSILAAMGQGKETLS